MKYNEYAIVPVELQDVQSADAIRRHCDLQSNAENRVQGQGFFNQQLLHSSFQTNLDACCRLPDLTVNGVGQYAVYLALLGTSICFVLHRLVNMPTGDTVADRRGTVQKMLRERQLLHRHFLGRKNAFSTTAMTLPITLPTKPAYVFSFTAFQDLIEADASKWDLEFKILADPVLVGLEADDSDSMGLTLDWDEVESEELTSSIVDVDRHRDSIAYVTWSTIVVACWGGANRVERTKAMVLGLELKLQMAWNKCYELSRRIDSIIDNGGEEDPEHILIGFTSALGRVDKLHPESDNIL